MTPTTHATCSHLSSDLLSELEGRVWCVQCDGYVYPDGRVLPRAKVGAPPVKRGGRFERAVGKRIPFYKR
jgi:hypothetical protein